MNSIWNKNIQSFEQRFPSLKILFQKQIDFINRASEKEVQELFSFWKILIAKNGSYTAEENNLKLHSSYNPEREALQSVTQPEIQNKNTIVFMGFGLGYQVEALAKQVIPSQNKKIILIEKDPLHFFAAMYYLDWTNIFMIEQLILAIDCPSQSIMQLLEDSSHINTNAGGVSTAYFFSIPAFTAHSQQYFDTVKTIIQRNKTKNDINAATYDKFAKRWITNSKCNTNFIGKLRTVTQLTAKDLEGNPERKKNFILIAAGPSLEKLLPGIKELKEKGIIVCVETALKALLMAGIEPDFIVITDPQYYAYKHIAGLKALSSTLICPISVYPSVFRFNCKEIILCSDLFPISQFYEKRLGSFGDLGAGGSVASSAFNFAYLMGAENIYLAGLDLSYPLKETHIRGSSGEQTFHLLSNKTQTVEKFSINSMYSAYPEYGLNYKGEKVLTDSRMKMFAWWFESRIASLNNINVYTLSKESLAIPGVKIKEDVSLKNDKDISNYSINQNNIKSSIDNSALSIIKSEYEKALNNLINLINKAVELCIINSSNLENELSAIEKEIAQNPLQDIVILAKPSSGYMEKHKTTPVQQAYYQKLQKDLQLYK